MGVTIDQFDVPVCNSFQAKVVKDQLCYELDPNRYRFKNKVDNDMFLTFFIDYNEDRQLILSNDDFAQNFITVETIGMYRIIFLIQLFQSPT